MIIIGFMSIVRSTVAKTVTKVEILHIFSFFIHHFIFSKRWYSYHCNNRINILYGLESLLIVL